MGIWTDCIYKWEERWGEGALGAGWAEARVGRAGAGAALLFSLGLSPVWALLLQASRMGSPSNCALTARLGRIDTALAVFRALIPHRLLLANPLWVFPGALCRTLEICMLHKRLHVLHLLGCFKCSCQCRVPALSHQEQSGLLTFPMHQTWVLKWSSIMLLWGRVLPESQHFQVQGSPWLLERSLLLREVTCNAKNNSGT